MCFRENYRSKTEMQNTNLSHERHGFITHSTVWTVADKHDEESFIGLGNSFNVTQPQNTDTYDSYLHSCLFVTKET